jgi:2-(1,2-epoxy-1,2-dihydrophenyl)acetyl-CoA isomerase
VYNSFNREMALQMHEALDACHSNSEVRAVWITGNGKAFCAGQDLQEVMDPNGPELSTIVREHYNPIVLRLRALEKPVVCAVNGVAAGAGANIALACDVVVSAQTATFIQAFSKIGLIPDSGGTYTLPRLVGLQKATAWMFLGDRISADEAERAGMIYKVFSDETLEKESLALAAQLASMPTVGLGLTKRALNATWKHTLEMQLALEDELQTEAGKTHDYNEGVRAFIEKRKPNFKGE